MSHAIMPTRDVDCKSPLVVDYDVTNIPPDNNKLVPVAKSAMEIGVESIEITTDRGFFDVEETKSCVDYGITPYVHSPLKYAVSPVKNWVFQKESMLTDLFTI